MNTASGTTHLQQVAVLHHPKIEATRPLAEEIATWLNRQGIQVRQAPTWDEKQIKPYLEELDLILVLGGDGSILRAARMAAGHEIPILAINMGRLGFLAELSRTNWRDLLPRVVQGDYWLERRMMLRAEMRRDGELRGEYLALNDVIISRGSLARVVRLKTDIDGDRLTTYVADGLIVATPTGSTAYALAVGGPILPPELRNILMIPIAPHLTLNRAIVLSEGSTIGVYVNTDHQAILTVDGQFEYELQDGDRVDVCASEHISHFIRLGKRTYFYHSLLARLEPRLAEEVE